MSGYINYEAALAHNEALRREASRYGGIRKDAPVRRVSSRPRPRNLPGSLVRGTRLA